MTDRFNGQWKIDLERSTRWDRERQQWMPSKAGREDLTFRIDGDRHDYENLVGMNPAYTLGFTARYDDPEWVPYMVRGMEGDAAPGPGMEVGKPLAYVRLIRIDDGFHYRVSKNVDGSPGYVMLRQILDDTTFVTRVFDADGTVSIVSYFNRV